MRLEFFWILTAAALCLGASCAEPYARLMAPYDTAVASFIARGHPWRIAGIDVVPGERTPGVVIRLRAEVRLDPEDLQPAAIVISRLQVGAAVETAVVFWTVLLLWPIGSFASRLCLLTLGVPVFLVLEALATVAPLMDQLSAASATLAGIANPLTLWERWSRLLESGGRAVIALCAALLATAVTANVRRRCECLYRYRGTER